MKKLTKATAGALLAVSVLALNPIGASAEWKQDNRGWWFSEDDSWATGWRSISGKWYYFDTDGYMVKNKDIKGWYLDDNGVGTECINSDGLDVVKSTGTIVKFNPDPNRGPGKSSIPFDIPGKIDDIEIKSIGKEAFEDCWYIKSITIPDGVISIGNEAFSCISSLTSITIPSSVKDIGQGAFSGNANLTDITIPEGVTSINSWMFFNCFGLTNVTIPSTVTTIKQAAFSNCKSLTNITIPNSVTNIEDAAFSDCSNLASVTIPDSVESIGDQAFYGCDNAVFYVESEKTEQYLISRGISASKIILNTK